MTQSHSPVSYLVHALQEGPGSHFPSPGDAPFVLQYISRTLYKQQLLDNSAGGTERCGTRRRTLGMQCHGDCSEGTTYEW